MSWPYAASLTKRMPRPSISTPWHISPGAYTNFHGLVPKISEAAPYMRETMDIGRAWGTRDWCVRYPNFVYTPVLSSPKDADAWTGRTGWVHAAMLEDYASQLASLDVYASGPPAMVEAIRSELTARGLPKQQLYFDSFDFAPDSVAKLTSAAAPHA